MQTKSSDINDMFSGMGEYPLERLSKSNRWVRIADSLDWRYIEERYNLRLGNQKRGAGNKPARMVIGALIVKHMLCASDECTIESIQENPYMQYLVGLKYFQKSPIFSPELFVSIRKRIDDKFFNDIILSTHRDSLRTSDAHDSSNNKSDDDNSVSHPQSLRAAEGDVRQEYTFMHEPHYKYLPVTCASDCPWLSCRSLPMHGYAHASL